MRKELATNTAIVGGIYALLYAINLLRPHIDPKVYRTNGVESVNFLPSSLTDALDTKGVKAAVNVGLENNSNTHLWLSIYSNDIPPYAAGINYGIYLRSLVSTPFCTDEYFDMSTQSTSFCFSNVLFGKIRFDSKSGDISWSDNSTGLEHYGNIGDLINKIAE